MSDNFWEDIPFLISTTSWRNPAPVEIDEKPHTKNGWNFRIWNCHINWGTKAEGDPWKLTFRTPPKGGCLVRCVSFPTDLFQVPAVTVSCSFRFFWSRGSGNSSNKKPLEILDQPGCSFHGRFFFRGGGNSKQFLCSTLLGVSWSNLTTPLKINMQPKNEGLEDDFPFSNRCFWGSMLIFQGCIEYFSDEIAATWKKTPTSFSPSRFCFQGATLWTLRMNGLPAYLALGVLWGWIGGSLAPVPFNNVAHGNCIICWICFGCLVTLPINLT